jgi:hypothetical protein
VATFGDATRYMREREHASVNARQANGAITVTLTHSLDPRMYDLPLTLKTYIPPNWRNVTITQGKNTQHVAAKNDEKGAYILYQLRPNTIKALLQP